MSSPTSGLLHAVRAVVFGTVALALAATAHVAGGAPLPGPGTLALLALPLACLSAALTRRRLGFAAIVGPLAAVQFALHELFMGLAAGGGCHPATTLSGTAHAAGTAHTAGSLLSCAATSSAGLADRTPMTGMAGHHLSTAMLVAHVLATAATAAVLAWGECSVWQLWTWLRRRLGVGLPAAPCAAVRPPVWAAAPDLPARTPDRSITRRGPPPRTVPALSG